MALRFLYEFTPTTLSTGRGKRALDVLIASSAIGVADAERLARVQLLNWYFEDLGEPDLQVRIHVPVDLSILTATLDSLDVVYHKVPAFDQADPQTVARIAQELDCDVVLSSSGRDGLHPFITDDIALVSDTIDAVMREAELHAKGFNAPWSFAVPAKHQPWQQFYALCEPSIFRSVLEEWQNSERASKETAEAMRLLVLSLQSLCFSRDQMAFYRQQDRWAHRAGLERQDFRFEYSTYLNHFYFTLYTAVDQVAGLVVHACKLSVEEENIGALYSAFQRAIKQEQPKIHKLFKDEAFWEMYKLLRDMRHTTAHRGPLTQQLVYMKDEDFTEAQLDEKAAELGYLDEIPFAGGPLGKAAIGLARYKAKLALLGPPLKHVVFVQHEDGSGSFYNPDPHADLDRFLRFWHRVVDAIKPWDQQRRPGDEALISRWRQDIEAIGVHINNVWIVWEHFKVVHAAGMANAAVVSQPSAIYFFVFIAKAIVEWVMLGIRRQMDRDVRSVSLINFLSELRSNPDVYDLERCVATFRARAAILSPEWQERYEQDAIAAFRSIACDAGDKMSPEKVGADIRALKKSCKALVATTSSYVAHNDRADVPPELPESEIEARIYEIYAVTRKYGRLFDAMGVGPGDPDAESMRALFSIPWCDVANREAKGS
jgi:hypothetical protein